MIELVLLTLLIGAALATAAVVGVLLFLVKIALWTVLLPLRLVLKLIWLPVGLTLGAVGLLLGTIAIPLLVVMIGGVLLAGLVAAIVALLLPLIPFVLLGLLIWSLMRRRPAVA
ncbi:MAG: hypothetical protein LC791_00930 [Acidobacteria bacterium]|nr:hypothetical protein [Acidobacteriota bacterium]